MKKVPDTETNSPPDTEREKGEEPLQFPGDVRPEWVREDIEIEDRKPSLEEIEEDTTSL